MSDVYTCILSVSVECVLKNILFLNYFITSHLTRVTWWYGYSKIIQITSAQWFMSRVQKTTNQFDILYYILVVLTQLEIPHLLQIEYRGGFCRFLVRKTVYLQHKCLDCELLINRTYIQILIVMTKTLANKSYTDTQTR